jgi:hypothetical protein
MFEFLYLGRVIEFVEKYPRESLAAAAAVLISHHIADVKSEKIKADAKIEAARIELQCELIRLETAKIETQNRHNQ